MDPNAFSSHPPHTLVLHPSERSGSCIKVLVMVVVTEKKSASGGGGWRDDGGMELTWRGICSLYVHVDASCTHIDQFIASNACFLISFLGSRQGSPLPFFITHALRTKICICYKDPKAKNKLIKDCLAKYWKATRANILIGWQCMFQQDLELCSWKYSDLKSFKCPKR